MSPVASSSRLFNLVKLGSKDIHRVAMAPLTRFRAIQPSQEPSEMAAEYYSQRASKGGLILTEASFISLEAGGYPGAPGIFTSEQIKGWKEVTSKVHAKGGVIHLQMWALGRANQGDDPAGIETVSASALPLKGTTIVPRELTVDDIARYVQSYKQAALNAVEAGFDGVEIHGANGYLIDQFLQSVSNKRTDSYGGSLENRARFTLEVTKAVSDAIGQEKTGLRFSPWSTFQDQQELNPYETFGYITKALVEQFPKLAYLHFVEPRSWAAKGTQDNFNSTGLGEGVVPSNDHFRAIVRGIDPSTLPKIKNAGEESFVFPEPSAAHPTLFLSACGYTRENSVSTAERTGDVIVFGRSFIANPDLPERIKQGVEFTKYDRSTFYTPGPVGYIDYPRATKVAA